MSLDFQNADLSDMFKRSLPPTSTSRALVPYYDPFKNSGSNPNINFKSSFKGGSSLAGVSPYASAAMLLIQPFVDLTKSKYQELLAKRDELSSNSGVGDTTTSFSDTSTTANDIATPDAPTLDMPSYDGTTLADILNNSGASVGEVAKQLQYSNALSSYNTDVSIAYSDAQLEQQLLTNELKKVSLEDNQMSLAFQQFMVDKSLLDSEVDIAYKELDNAMQVEILNSLNNISISLENLTNVSTQNSSVMTDSINGISKNINTPERSDFYQKQNIIADHQTTPQTVTDLDGETVITDTPLNIKTKADATLAKKTTDENNLELEDDDFHMWDTLPEMDFLSYVGYSSVDEIS